MKKIFEILVMAIGTALLFQNCQKSDFIVVTGIVTDSLTNEPIEGANIFSDGKKIAISALDGTFAIEGMTSGRKSFSVYGPSYRHILETRNVTISSGRVTKMIFSLKMIGDPQIENEGVFDITQYAAKAKGFIRVKDGAQVYLHGHCWSISVVEPTLSNSIYDYHNGSSVNNTFESSLKGLTPNTRYFVRAFAQTSLGTFYSNTIVFNTAFDFPGILTALTFDDGFYDESGNSNGFYSNAQSVADRFGRLNHALSFNNNYSYNAGTRFKSFNEFTLSFWIKKSSWSGMDKPWVNIGYWSYNNEIRLGEGAFPNNFYFDIKTNNGMTKVALTSYPSENEWHHIVALRNNTQIKLYMDGELKTSANCDGLPIITESWAGGSYGYLFIGQYQWWQSNDGTIDDLRMYDHALTDVEIEYLRTH